MTYSESDLVPLSALQLYLFCPRQCALIHVEQTWEKLHSMEGSLECLIAKSHPESFRPTGATGI